MLDKPKIEQHTPLRKERWTPKVFLCKYLKGIFYVAIICALTSLASYIPDRPHSFLIALIISLSIGISCCTLIFLFIWLFNPKADRTLIWTFVIITFVVCGTIAGYYIGPFILRHVFLIEIPYFGSFPLQSIIGSLIVGCLIGFFFYSQGLVKHVKKAAEQERINRLASEKEALEANLRLLQAQIEPHFLFNTLSNILSLIDTQPSKGKSMLMDLILYMRTSLSTTLPEMTRLDQEMDALRAYLNIQKIRLGDRLHFTVNIAETLRQHPFPPMLLQPLVENAVKHGLEPRIEGGQITITATEENGSIRITVADTGTGFSSSHRNGVGIANVKERIRLIYGDKGCLFLEENHPCGVRAVIEVPKNDI